MKNRERADTPKIVLNELARHAALGCSAVPDVGMLLQFHEYW